MSEWVEVKYGGSFPPESHNVLLYIFEYSKEGWFWDDYYLIGCWSEQLVENQSGFYHTNNCGIFEGKHKLIENDFIKVKAWTLLPNKPIFEIKKSYDNFSLNEKVIMKKGII